MYADRDVIFALLELGPPPPMEAGRDAVQAYFERLAEHVSTLFPGVTEAQVWRCFQSLNRRPRRRHAYAVAAVTRAANGRQNTLHPPAAP